MPRLTFSPSFNISPWIFLDPQCGFCRARRRTNSWISSVIGGLPGRRFGRKVQCRRTSSRCQRSSVSGYTIKRAVARRRLKRRKPASTSQPLKTVVSRLPAQVSMQDQQLLAEEQNLAITANLK